MKVVYKSDESISIQDKDGLTKAFIKVIIDNNGKVKGKNKNFKKEVEAFAGKGFLDD